MEHLPFADWSQPLDLQRLQHALATAAVGHTIVYQEQVDSTMRLAHQLAADPAVHSGTLVVAEEQTAGRGRRQRTWSTPPYQALLYSLILKAPLALPLTHLPMAAALVAVETVERLYPSLRGQVGIKWPNDLLFGAPRSTVGKWGGILVENSFYGSAVQHAVIGMGLNVFQQRADLPPAMPAAPPPTSLAAYLSTMPGYHQQIDRTSLLLALSAAWATWISTAAEIIFTRWRAQLWTLGETVTVHQATAGGESIFDGTAVDVTPTGHLLLCDGAGQYHELAAGDVSIRRAVSDSHAGF